MTQKLGLILIEYGCSKNKSGKEITLKGFEHMTFYTISNH